MKVTIPNLSRNLDNNHSKFFAILYPTTLRLFEKTSQITLVGQISPLGDLFVRYSIVAQKIKINRRGIINSTANKIYFSN